MNNEQHSIKTGVLAGACAYILWGALPIYWKWLDHIPAQEVLAHRILWSFILLMILLIVIGRGPSFLNELKQIIKNPRLLIGVILSAVFITANWYIYIWSVTNNHIVRASLGYYINPLVSVLLGVFLLKEKLTKVQWLSVALAGVAVTILTVSLGTFPYVALGLAFSFGFYGLLKKIVQVGSLSGLAMETLIVLPFALLFLSLQHGGLYSMFYLSDFTTLWLLIGAGLATAAPLLFFGASAKRIPLSLLGFLQYIAPTMMLLLGVFLYDETFSLVHFITFGIIWLALIMFSVSKYQVSKKLKRDALIIVDKHISKAKA
ncbi:MULTISPECIES: EamA family transporter RarD [Bacillaceae]|uniref:EamA family transporter RarD n=1 Tax=Evansella alkalicola TaxID=745819 RepID=A0ABS6JN00_9BACI|nr:MULTISPECIES: EamA family transporter RarD [Bacillaceae]MBU9719933.1 EamA family transporter RarD [Bacillus alkalicola]